MNIPTSAHSPAPPSDKPVLPPDVPEPVPEQEPPDNEPAPIVDPSDEQAPIKAKP